MPLPRGVLAVPVALVAPAVVAAQQPMNPEQQAEQALTAAQNALKANDPNAATAKFNEVIQKFGNTRAAVGAKFGLAGLQLAADNPDLNKAIEWLRSPAEDGAFTDRGAALYQYATCFRLLGLRELEKGGNPADAKKAADTKFGEALRWFAAARDWYAGQKQDDWAARARCDLAEIELRMGRVKEARTTAEPFTKDAALAKNPHRSLGLYHYGLASFLDKDYPAAFRALSQTDVFKHPTVGGHARYLAGRIHHLQDEKAEASVHYDAVLADYEKAKAAAVEAIKDPNKFKGRPFELARLRALATGPVPEFVSGAAFHTAGLKYEGGKFGEAVDKFQAFLKANPNDPLAADAQLRIGFCQVQLRQFDEAVKTLAPLAEKHPRLTDQAWFWLGKAQFGLAQSLDPNNPAEREKQTKAALDTLRKAADKAREFAQQNDADAKTRRYEILFEWGDSLAIAKLPKDAAAVYEQLWIESHQLSALRREEVLQRLAVVLGTAGEYQRSDDRAAEFRRTFPQSTLTAAVAFRSAENSYARAMNLAKMNDRNRADELKQRYDETIGKFQEVADKFPEFERANHARLGAAVCLAQLNKLDDAAKLLEAIPGPDRNGELALAAYLLADILLRQTPLKVGDDALEENKAREKLTAAAGLFDGFVGGNAKAPEAPAALLKLGYCHKRLGATLADPNERNQTLQKAREAFERLGKEFPKDPLVGTATLELAKVKALQGDRGGAMNDLRSVFTNEETKNTPTAPLAALHLATLLRQENKPADAVAVLEKARQQYEGTLAGDKERTEWVPLLKYHHGISLQEAQKFAEARKLLDEVAQTAREKPVGAEAALRSGQCKLAEVRKQLEDGWKKRNEAGNDQNKKNAAEQAIQQARNGWFEVGDAWVRRADEWKQPLPAEPSRGRMLYEAAWAFRELANEEAQQAWEQARKEAQAKLPPNSPAVNVPRAKVPLTRCETRAFDAYKKLIDDFGDTALSVDARLEWAELLAEREAHTEVVKLLKDALDKEPADRPVPPETTERIRMRLGGSLFATKAFADAARQFDTVTANEKSLLRAQAQYRAGESHAAAGDAATAIERLLPFRDKGEFHNVGGISDRAVLRLGHAQIAAKKLDDARATFEAHLNRYGQGNPFAAEVRYGLGLIQQEKGQHDEAVKAFEAVIASTQTEVAAKAQLQIGQCRLAQKKYADAASAFLLVTFTYDYPDLTFAALLEAARAFEEDKKPTDAEKVLNKLVKDAPADSEWHKAAKER
ncbi:MAG: tetratricopeptide repeat protein, partial [Fimbriiglobus sp.]|nr:tetratricopeptide repeat protein [Fimbriiglobus sp.]